MTFGALLLFAVSYGRDVAPIFAFHCNSCHGDSGTAAGLTTGTASGLREAVNPGDPDGSPIVGAIEGARGEERRMPLGAPPLKPGQIAIIRRWIEEGAQDDGAAAEERRRSVAGVRIRKGKALRIECRAPGPAYLIMNLTKSGRALFERRAAVQSAEEPVVWTVWPEKGWPGTVNVEVRILYAGSGDGEVRLRVE
jgi:hypothetical protein